MSGLGELTNNIPVDEPEARYRWQLFWQLQCQPCHLQDESNVCSDVVLLCRAVVAMGTVISSFPDTIEVANGLGLLELVQQLSQSAGTMPKLTEAANHVWTMLKRGSKATG